MGSEIVVRPGAGSFAPRSADDVRAALSKDGVTETGEAWEVTLGDGRRVTLRLEEQEGELRAVRVAPGDGDWIVAGRVARRLNWSVVDARGVARSPSQLRRPGETLTRVRGLLAVLGGAMAVLFGFAWAVRRGSDLVWLLLAILGMGLYAAMRVWSWLGRSLGRSAPGGGGRT